MSARKNAPIVRLNREQRAWCRNYKNTTGFAPLMDDFLAGNEPFRAAAHKSVRWFEDWSTDAHLEIGRNIPEDESPTTGPGERG